MAGATAGIMLPWGVACSGTTGSRDKFGEILPLRKLGGTGETVTMLGVGGYHVGWTTEKDAQEVIETAIQGGIRFFDTAHNYGKGMSEERYGKFLVPKYRDQVFLMTKTQAMTGASLLEEVNLSLNRLQCDYVDLLQLHSFKTPEDVDQRIEDGVIDAILEIKKSGKARYIGFTGHQNPYALLRMLEKLPEFPSFSTLQMPINLVDYASQHSFIRKVIPGALDQELGLLAMKTLADGRFFNKKETNGKLKWETDTPVVPDYVSIREAEFFAWSLPISVLITGAENSTLLNEKIAFAREFASLSEDDRAMLLEKVEKNPEREAVEYYKKIK